MIAETNMLNEQDILQEIETGTKVFVVFYADRCPHCKAMEKILEKISQNNNGNNVCPIVKVNVDNMPSLAQKYSVRSIPTFILFKDGIAVSKKVGQTTQDVVENMISG